MAHNVTTIGRLKLRKILPEGYNNVDRPLNSKELSGLLTRIAKDSTGDDYAHMLRDLTNFGFETAHTYGGVASIHLDDLRLPKELADMRKAIKRKVYLISQRRDIDPKTKNQLIIKAVKEATPAIDKAVMDALGSRENSFGLLVSTGSKGKPQQLRQLVFGDLLTVDSKMRDIPYPTFRSYGEGVSPLQYWTASHGGRYGYIQVQKATADAGYFSKQTRGVVHRQVVMADDCHRARPYIMSADDENTIGALLYGDVKGESGKIYKANTPITEEILEDLSGNVKIRSAICCGLADGVCSKCAGVRESGRLPDIGDAVGLNGINAGNEQITQMGLCLHENTEVRMADGTVKAIKDIKAGELVMAANMDGRQYPTPVVANHYNGVKTIYKFTCKRWGYNTCVEICCTSDHKLLKQIAVSADNIYTTIEAIGISHREQYLILADGTRAEIVSEDPMGNVQTYDLEIATPEHLFVLANGLIVSNSAKHSGGESVSANRVKRGFAAVEQFINMPDNFVGGAGVAPVDGKVRKIEKAPQGGMLIHINDDVTHIPAGLEPTVKEGQYVEAGDLISDGMPNIETITKYKGIGYGRKAFTEALYDIMASNGSAVPKKQLEPFARAFIDKVEIVDPDGLQGWIYGDIASYTKLEAGWKTRKDSYESNISAASGKYLDKPVLHYTIGTRLTPSIIKDISEAGVSKVVVNDKEPPFKPVQLSAKQYVAQDEDWIAALSGEGLTKSFLQHAQQGSDAKKGSTSYYPDLAFIGTSDEKPLTV